MKRCKVLKVIVVIFMPIGLFIILGGMLSKIVAAYFYIGWKFWREKQ